MTGWKLIDDAPKHESIILCCWWKHRPDCPFVAEGFRDWDGVWKFQSGEAVEDKHTPPTHFKKMPKPPKAQTKQ